MRPQGTYLPVLRARGIDVCGLTFNIGAHALDSCLGTQTIARDLSCCCQKMQMVILSSAGTRLMDRDIAHILVPICDCLCEGTRQRNSLCSGELGREHGCILASDPGIVPSLGALDGVPQLTAISCPTQGSIVFVGNTISVCLTSLRQLYLYRLPVRSSQRSLPARYAAA